MSRETIFKCNDTMADALTEHPCRSDQTSDEAREYRKMPLPGERKNPKLETRSVDRPRRGHGY
jgi:hypothetical protein